MLNKWNRLQLTLLTLALVPALGFTQTAQNKEEPKTPGKFYRLEFVFREMDGTKVVNSRTYTTQAETNRNSTDLIRASSKVPVQFSPNSYSQVDVSVRIDCSELEETSRDQLSLHVTADVSTLVPESTMESTGEPAKVSHPILRNTQWQSRIQVLVRKPDIIFSSDDVTSKHQLQLQLTATSIP